MQSFDSPPPIPNPDGQLTPPQNGPRERGGCLTAFLGLALVVNPLLGVFYLLGGSRVAAAIPGFPAWVIPILGVLCLLNFVFMLGIWNWKKWGVYGFLGASAIAFFINVSTLGLGQSLSSLIGVGILIILLRDVWARFE